MLTGGAPDRLRRRRTLHPGHPPLSLAPPAPMCSPRTPPSRRGSGAGVKGPRLYDWVFTSLPCYVGTTPPGWARWLLVRRSADAERQG